MAKENTYHEEFLELFEPLKERLWRYCLTLNFNRETAREVLSQTVYESIANFHKLKNKQAFLSYLFTIASRVNARFIRQRRRESVPADEGYFDALACSSDAIEKLQIRELHEALDKLPPEQKEAIVLFDLMGMTRAETAAIQGVSESALKKRLERGRAKLREILTEGSSVPKPVTKFLRSEEGRFPENSNAIILGKERLDRNEA